MQWKDSDVSVASVAHDEKRKRRSNTLLCSAVLLGAVALGVLLAYRAVSKSIKDSVDLVSETCADSDPAAHVFSNAPATTLQLWVYNISNPDEYAAGSTAEMYEQGPYGIRLKQKRHDVDFSESEGTVTFNLYNDVKFKSSASCSDCLEDDTVNALNYAYLNLLAGAQNEGLLIISTTCTPTQIGLIQDTSGTYGYCDTSEMGENVMCRCCAPTPTANATTCSDLASRTSKGGGILSWLAKYDNGLKLDDVGSDFPLSTGAYTPLVRRLGITELTFGSASAQIGMIKTASSLTSSPPDMDTVYMNSNLTADLRDACYSLYCPSVETVVSQVMGGAGQAAIRDVSCAGTVPSSDVLQSEAGLTKERADELRYLEGVSCQPFGISVAIAALLSLDAGATKQCADGTSLGSSSPIEPCCLASFESSAFGVKGSGVGCHQWVNGLVQPRRVFSNDEAKQYIKPSPETKFYTGCAKGKQKFQQIMWKGETSYKDWFTPDTYTYPNMPWADPTIVKSGLSGTGGTMTYFNISGYQAAIRSGRGITSSFLDYQLTDGDPKYDTEEIWSSYKLNTLTIKHEKKHDIGGIEVNKFLPDISKAITDEDIEATQRRGEVPYQNMENMVYASDGGPVIMSFPNFFGSDEAMLSQSSNVERGSASSVGVNLYRTRDSYSKHSSRLSSPEMISVSTWQEYGSSEYLGYINIEPATGLTLKGAIANQISSFTWNCNPQLDPTCGFMASVYNASDPMCYIAGGVNYPCNAGNVFTPKVMGGKVLPLYWLHVNPEAPDYLSASLKSGLDARYAMSILVIIIPVLCFVGIVFLCTQIAQMQKKATVRATLSPGRKSEVEFETHSPF
mmetsp:Transcript_14867/g.22359  ORF Transcript_14867/g.22359 Transcript_14867/m.22359 type:complete len:848 (+) Transcript_14867:86-2629(+)|eukprot:CAMPEP_0185018384 /NCGR_PEP_ID=MMETSP1103-20130426/1123_1 /TAXON_ID=36769 /ORGANISM="Paraphysomonas bandaiensis, Strain Caron Lab Isolate" /LENGTH=847 /DNA_ID=CAMNT_0027548179 /DNA_START=83 /DNA_END=2626 /DNA_ORIENTATION=-